QAGQLTQAASDIAVGGGNVVNALVSTMQGIHDSSRRIADLVGIVDGIAFQANTLTLSAAAEAARAGEQGENFAVVAGEINILAQRNTQAVKEIKALMDDASVRVSCANEQAHRTGEAMREVGQSVKRATMIMDEVSSASQEQSAGIAQVNQALIQMDHVTQQNSALVEEAAAASIFLEEQAQQLNSAVSVFLLKDAERYSAPPQEERVPQFNQNIKAKETASNDDWQTF
ncbi:MAG: methyl-accepting chemotaxis protein, partial [Glaciimonas sp.]|nr:methyl-accepting chemotaxis protein [Glaciimonas sp.]